jgi:hypothetical protein
MDTRDQAVVERPEFDELMRLLDRRSAHVVQVLGVAGVGVGVGHAAAHGAERAH